MINTLRLFSCGLLAASLAACGSNSASTAADSATRVTLSIAGSGPASAALHFHGVVASRDEMRLSFKVGGVIKRLAVEAGDSVHRGQLLAEIELTEINSQVAQAQQLADKAARDLQRGERLHADEVISLEQLQNLRTQNEMAAAQLRATRFNRGYAAITAPADGVVLRRLAEEHEQVPAGQPVLVLGAASRGYIVKAAIADRELVQLHVGDAATVMLDAAPGMPLVATVSELARAADPATGLFPVELKLQVNNQTLASGMVAEASVHPGVAANAATTRVRIPASALVAANGNSATVFVASGERAHQRTVTIAFIDGADVALISGVQVGESVVSAGAPYLDDNALIKTSASTP
jgi:RND family efflux transporter MFP subunit